MVGFPLLLIPLAIYNIIVFLMPGVSFTDPLAKLTLMSGAELPVTLSDVLLTLGILLLLAEVIKGARPGAKYLTDHLLSLIVFGAAAAEFVLWPKFGTSTFFLLTALALVDFISGLALRTRRRAVATAAPAPAKKSVEKVAAPAAEPVAAPAAPAPAAPAPAAPTTPAAASVAESVLRDRPEPRLDRPEPRLDHPEPRLDRPEPRPDRPEPRPDHPEPRPDHPEPKLDHLEPKPAQPVVAPDPASPELPLPDVPSPVVPSPELQPNSGSPPSPDKPETPKH
jgi:hypothetical protein